MSNAAQCPNCSKSVTIPANAAGRKVRCPGCAAVSVVAIPLSDDDPPMLVPPPEAEESKPARPTPAAKEEPKKGAPWKLIAVVSGCVLLLAVAGGAIAVIRMRPLPEIPESEWHPVEVPGFLKARLPGFIADKDTNPNTFGLKAEIGPEGKKQVYAVGFRRYVGDTDYTSQNEAMQSFAGRLAYEMTEKPDLVEVTRDEITLGPYRGRQFIMRDPKSSEKVIARCYLTNSGMVAIAAAGRRLTPDHPNVQKLFASLEILSPLPPKLPDPPVTPTPPTPQPPFTPDPPVVVPKIDPEPPPSGPALVKPQQTPIVFKDIGDLLAVEFTANKDLIAVGGLEGVAWYDLATGNVVTRRLGERKGKYAVDGATVSRAGDRIALFGRNFVHAFERDKDEATPLALQVTPVLQAVFDSSGRNLAILGADTNKMEVWDLTDSPPKRKEVNPPQNCVGLTLSPDGRMLGFVRPNKEFALIDSTNLTPRGSIELKEWYDHATLSFDNGHAAVWNLSISAPRSGLALCSTEEKNKQLRAKSWKQVVPNGTRVACAAFTPKNGLVVLTETGMLSLYSLPAGELVAEGRILAPGMRSHVALAVHPNPNHPDGLLVAVAVKDNVRIYDLNRLPKPSPTP